MSDGLVASQIPSRRTSIQDSQSSEWQVGVKADFSTTMDEFEITARNTFDDYLVHSPLERSGNYLIFRAINRKISKY